MALVLLCCAGRFSGVVDNLIGMSDEDHDVDVESDVGVPIILLCPMFIVRYL